MLYEIGNPCDISAMLLNLQQASNRLTLVGTVIDTAEQFSKDKSLFKLKVLLEDNMLVNVFLTEEDIPNSKVVLIDGELWNSRKGYTAYRSTVDIHALNVVELESTDEIPKEYQNRVRIEGAVCMHPVYMSEQKRYEIVLLTRTSLGEMVRMLCSVPKGEDEEKEEYERGKQKRINGEIRQRTRRKRCGKVYIEDGVFNYIESRR